MSPDSGVGIVDFARLGWYAVKLVVLTALAAEAFARIGSGLNSFARFRPSSPLVRFGAGYLAGFGCVGPLLLGLALTRLYTPFAIWPAFLALVAGACRFGRARFLLVPAARELKSVRAIGGALLGISLFPLLYYLLTPEGHIDSYIYHLATPWQYLQNRGAVLNLVPTTSHLSLPVETVFTFPLLLGDDRLSVWLNFLCFLSAGAVFAGGLPRNDPGSRDAAWLGTLLALAGGYLFTLMCYAKSDIAAASLFVAGALISRSGARTLGIVLLGMSAAAKPVCAPLVLIWIALYPPPLRSSPIALLLMAVWPLPWMGKEFLATGNPIFPFAASLFPSPEWGPTNQLLNEHMDDSFLQQDTRTFAGLLPAWIGHMRTEHLILTCLLPGLLFLGSSRRAIIGLVAGQIVVLGLAHHTRYVIAAVWLLSLLAAEEIRRLKGKWRATGIIFLAGFSILRITTTNGAFALKWRETLRPFEEVLAARQTTYYETILTARQMDPDRVLLLGERRTYLMPGRILYGGTRGENPLVWKMANESNSYDHLRRKFRQTGASLLIYNYVSAEWLAQLYYPFHWTPRMVDIYKEFARKHLVPMTHNATNDFYNGGFYIFGLLRRPLDPPQASIWFLPGTESLFGLAITLENLGRKDESLQNTLEILGKLREVGHAWNQVGHAYTQINDSGNAYRYLLPFFNQGMMDQLNLPELGSVAVRLAKLDMAQELLDDSKWRYPHQIDTIHVNEALLCGQRAYKALLAKNTAEAERWLEKSDRLLALVPEKVPNPTLAEARRSTLGALTALRAELMIEYARWREAGELYRQAVRIYPASPQAPRWKDLASKYAPGVLSLGAGREGN